MTNIIINDNEYMCPVCNNPLLCRCAYVDMLEKTNIDFRCSQQSSKGHSCFTFYSDTFETFSSFSCIIDGNKYSYGDTKPFIDAQDAYHFLCRYYKLQAFL